MLRVQYTYHNREMDTRLTHRYLQIIAAMVTGDVNGMDKWLFFLCCVQIIFSLDLNFCLPLRNTYKHDQQQKKRVLSNGRAYENKTNANVKYRCLKINFREYADEC